MGHDTADAHEERRYLARATRRVEYLTMANLGALAFIVLIQIGTDPAKAADVFLAAFGIGMFGYLIETEPMYETRKHVRRELSEWWANR